MVAVMLAALPLIGIAASAAREEFAAVMRRNADPENGKQLYETCAACHGVAGGGVSDGTVPAIAGQHYRVIVKQLVDFRHDRRWDIRMEHFTDRHRLPDPQQLADLAGYVSGLPRTNHPGGADPELLQRGANVYFARCEQCHGASGQGTAEALVPRACPPSREARPRRAARHRGLSVSIHIDAPGAALTRNPQRSPSRVSGKPST
jgi:cytochrome c553